MNKIFWCLLISLLLFGKEASAQEIFSVELLPHVVQGESENQVGRWHYNYFSVDGTARVRNLFFEGFGLAIDARWEDGRGDAIYERKHTGFLPEIVFGLRQEKTAWDFRFSGGPAYVNYYGESLFAGELLFEQLWRNCRGERPRADVLLREKLLIFENAADLEVLFRIRFAIDYHRQWHFSIWWLNERRKDFPTDVGINSAIGLSFDYLNKRGNFLVSLGASVFYTKAVPPERRNILGGFFDFFWQSREDWE